VLHTINIKWVSKKGMICSDNTATLFTEFNETRSDSNSFVRSKRNSFTFWSTFGVISDKIVIKEGCLILDVFRLSKLLIWVWIGFLDHYSTITSDSIKSPNWKSSQAFRVWWCQYNRHSAFHVAIVKLLRRDTLSINSL
jgi:hypothetical protein